MRRSSRLSTKVKRRWDEDGELVGEEDEAPVSRQRTEPLEEDDADFQLELAEKKARGKRKSTAAAAAVEEEPANAAGEPEAEQPKKARKKMGRKKAVTVARVPTATLTPKSPATLEHVLHAVWTHKIMPLIGVKELWALRLKSKYLYHDAGAALTARAQAMWGPGGDLEAIALWMSMDEPLNMGDAKRTFSLGDQDLAGLKVKINYHRRWMKRWEEHLYQPQELVQAVIRRHGSVSAMREYQGVLRDRAAAREERLANASTRETQLSKWLADAGIAIHNLPVRAHNAVEKWQRLGTGLTDKKARVIVERTGAAKKLLGDAFDRNNAELDSLVRSKTSLEKLLSQKAEDGNNAPEAASVAPPSESVAAEGS